MILEDGASKHSTGDWPGRSCNVVTCQRTSHEEIDSKRADPASPAGRMKETLQLVYLDKVPAAPERLDTAPIPPQTSEFRIIMKSSLQMRYTGLSLT